MDFKKQARIHQQAALRLAECTTDSQKHFYMDFGFMRASQFDHRCPNKISDRVIKSFNGFTSYLLIVDETSCHMWVFLNSTKDPPLEIIDKFLLRFGHPDGGLIRTDQGGELAGSQSLVDIMLQKFHYAFEPTGADNPSQNGAVEIYNDKLAVCTHTLLLYAVWCRFTGKILVSCFASCSVSE
jgi:hypothetical protein